MASALSTPDTSVVLDVFRRLRLRCLHQAERLSEAFMSNLLSWVHQCFALQIGTGAELPPRSRENCPWLPADRVAVPIPLSSSAISQPFQFTLPLPRGI